MALTDSVHAPIRLHDRERIERFLRRDTAMHIYALADLEEPLWSATTWFGLEDEAGELSAIALWFEMLDPPVLYGVCPPADGATGALLRALAPRLPARMYTDLGPGFEGVFAPERSPSPAVEFVKMVLDDRGALSAAVCDRAEALDSSNLAELEAFFAADAYRDGEADGRFFAPYMLARGPYYGIREGGRLVAAGGVHVRSDRYGVAAVGNVATAPGHRSRGLARAVTAAVCRDLAAIPVVGLNVAAANTPALRCYQSLGFEVVGAYVEQEYRAAD